MEEKKKTNHKLSKAESEERKFNRDFKSCTRCHYFWGNDSRCMSSHCFKEKKKEVQGTKNSECIGCPYKQGDGYCFPCMKKLLEKKVTREECGEEEKV